MSHPAVFEISNNDDVIDSRDVIARLADLVDAGTGQDLDEIEERVALRRLVAEGEDATPDWPYGATLIRDSYFRDYAQELAEELGADLNRAVWPYTCIDWDAAARDLRQDYTAIEWDGVTYWTR